MQSKKVADSSSGGAFLKGLFGFSMSTWINCIIEFISTPIITYFFAPEEFGMINMYLVYLEIFVSFSYLGLDRALTRFYSEPTGKNTNKSLLTICLSGSLIFGLFLVGFIWIFGSALSVEIVERVTYAIPLALSLGVLSQVALRYFQLSSRMRKNAVMYTVQSVVVTWIKNLSFIFIAFKTATAIPAIITIAVSSVVIAIIFFFIRVKKEFSFQCDVSKNALAPIIKYSFPFIFVEVVTKLNNRVSQLVLNFLIPKAQIGIYSNASRIASIIMLIQTGFNAYWSPFVYENYKTGKKKIEKVHHMITFAMTSLGLLIMFFQYPIYLILVNRQYWGSREIFPFLLIGPLCYTIAETLGLGINIAKKTFWHIIISAINIIVNIVLCFTLIPLMGVAGAAISSGLAAICNMTLKTIIGERYYKCTSTYWRMIFSVILVFSAAFVNYYFPIGLLKYFAFLICMVIEVLIYRKEFIKIITVMLKLVKQILKRGN